MKTLTVSTLLLLIFGCATMTREECQTMDWKELGTRDAKDGKIKANFMEHRNRCREFGILGDKKTYVEGYNVGLKDYCTYENGYEVGSNGKNYLKICPGTDQKEFLRGFHAGKNTFDQKQYYENQQALQREELTKQAIFREKMKANMQNKSCSWAPDCKINDKCDNNKCSNTGKVCTFDPDCTIQGNCDAQKCKF